ncbi:hypothetical protein BT93_C2559 [Corymbia citriodora subsp. variegata]|nr:hypothetical protein BT93_C2559 [Corymbia citriodora subsp. variegata]
MCMILSVIQQPKRNRTETPWDTSSPGVQGLIERNVRLFRRAIRGAESQWPRGVDDRLVLLPEQPLVLVAERGAVHPVVDVGQEVAPLDGRRDKLDATSVERVVQDGVAHLVALELGIEVASLPGLEGLVVGDAVLVVLADDADLGRADGLRLFQGPRAEVLAALAVDHALDGDLHGPGDGLVGRRCRGGRS